jgi:hypothetical protein
MYVREVYTLDRDSGRSFVVVVGGESDAESGLVEGERSIRPNSETGVVVVDEVAAVVVVTSVS